MGETAPSEASLFFFKLLNAIRGRGKGKEGALSAQAQNEKTNHLLAAAAVASHARRGAAVAVPLAASALNLMAAAQCAAADSARALPLHAGSVIQGLATALQFG